MIDFTSFFLIVEKKVQNFRIYLMKKIIKLNETIRFQCFMFASSCKVDWRTRIESEKCEFNFKFKSLTMKYNDITFRNKG